MPNKRVVAAMSGGVDSSTALALLKGEGYDCIGVSMQLWDYSKKDDHAGASAGSCCSLDDICGARSVADGLGVPFYVVNLEAAFARDVVDNFVEEYRMGRTPNPCVRCNQFLKFDALMRKASALEADYVATGHYARVEAGNGAWRLLKGVDPEKDQSYFLFTMTQEQLSRTLFPLGGLTKDEVRAIARRLGLKTHNKGESQEICFVDEAGYAAFLSGRIQAKPGDIINEAGERLGAHNGLYNYTIGQRKGLGLSGGPHYVVGIDVAANRLIVGGEDGLYLGGLTASGVNWISRESAEALQNGGLRPVTAKIRYRHEGVEADVTLGEGGLVRVAFKTPQRSVTPGQAVVFYRGEEVLGGGWIERGYL
ncbi:MAG: tRNA 2-thiouridine(34) synthase MnmA [Deltaproteobacteria bacterium]|nr:tRNA 2-thiouridine(34) synthase MnmA [Deltaproteobacteria bacterium]